MTPSIETNRYFNSHMKTPRGRGLWLFETAARAVVFEFNGSYAEAKKAAQDWARANGQAALYVCP